MTKDEQRKSGQETCPKRVWVLNTLSDDEVIPVGDPIPPGLKFHLARCDSCRKLADELLGVTAVLGQMLDLEPSGELGGQAEAQAMRSLREGAVLTGRVSIPDDPIPTPTARAVLPWLPYRRFAAAAVILLAIGLYAMFRPDSPGIQPGEYPHGLVTSPKPGDHPRLIEQNGVPGAPNPALAESSQKEGETIRQAEVGPDAPVICNHRTRLEAALCENPNAIHRVAPLPARRRRRVSPRPPIDGPMNAIDISGRKRSTKPRQRD